MKKVSKRKGSASIDTVPLPEKELNLPVKHGYINKLRGKYFLVIDSRMQALPVGSYFKTKDLSYLLGKEVIAVYSSRRYANLIAIGTWPTPESPNFEKKLILCDIGSTPTPELRNIRKRMILLFAGS